MTGCSSETTQVHTRLLKCALEIEESRAYWRHVQAPGTATPQRAFDEYWFGAKSLARVDVLLSNMRARFDAHPTALAALHRWSDMAPDTRRLVCHWHVQVSDPLYRAFTGTYLVARRAGPRTETTRDLVLNWVSEHAPGRWTMATRIQCASKLLSAAYAAGLVASNRDPRPVIVPRVPDEALTYLLYLLRGLQFEGTLLQSPYLASVGLEGAPLAERLRNLSGISFGRQGDLVDVAWHYADLAAWAETNITEPDRSSEGGRS